MPPAVDWESQTICHAGPPPTNARLSWSAGRAPDFGENGQLENSLRGGSPRVVAKGRCASRRASHVVVSAAAYRAALGEDTRYPGLRRLWPPAGETLGGALSGHRRRRPAAVARCGPARQLTLIGYSVDVDVTRTPPRPERHVGGGVRDATARRLVAHIRTTSPFDHHDPLSASRCRRGQHGSGRNAFADQGSHIMSGHERRGQARGMPVLPEPRS